MSTNMFCSYVNDGKIQNKSSSVKYNKVQQIRPLMTILFLQQWITFTQGLFFVDMMILMSKQTTFLGTGL